jgi:hypothetical protein
MDSRSRIQDSNPGIIYDRLASPDDPAGLERKKAPQTKGSWGLQLMEISPDSSAFTRKFLI